MKSLCHKPQVLETITGKKVQSLLNPSMSATKVAQKIHFFKGQPVSVLYFYFDMANSAILCLFPEN